MRSVLVGEPVADPRRGEIYEVNLDPAKGREQKGRRPCLVVSGDPLNRSGLGTVIVCPLTTTHRPKYVWRTRLDPADIHAMDAAWAVEINYVQTDQVLTLDVEDGRLLRHLGTVTNARKLNEVTASVYKMFAP